MTESATEWEFRLSDLGGWRRIRTMKELKAMIPGATFIFAQGKQQEEWLTRGHVYQPMVVAVSLDTPRRLLASIELTAAEEIATGCITLVTKFSALSALVLYAISARNSGFRRSSRRLMACCAKRGFNPRQVLTSSAPARWW